MRDRIIGYDVARALAIIGMVFVNFHVVLQLQGADLHADGVGGWLAHWITGRAAATFVVLAGVGIALLSGRAIIDPSQRPAVRKRLLARAFFLAVIGWPFLIVWEGDILHFYAAYFLAGAFMFHWKIRYHLLFAGILPLLFLLVLPVWERNWDFETLTYNNIWTAQGQLMSLFLNGFHPLIPWLAFLAVGMALGRYLQRSPEKTLWIALPCLAVSALTEWASSIGIAEAVEAGVEAELAKALLGTSSLPPMPQYILGASCFSVALICLGRRIGDKSSNHWIFHPLVCLGQMALTLYVVHFFAGVFPLYVMASENPAVWSLGTCVMATALFCGTGIISATLWKQWLPRGPAEWLMRRFSDFPDQRRWLALTAAAGSMALLVTVTAVI